MRLSPEELDFINRKVSEHTWAIGRTDFAGNLLKRLYDEHRDLSGKLSDSEDYGTQLEEEVKQLRQRLWEERKEYDQLKDSISDLVKLAKKERRWT